MARNTRAAELMDEGRRYCWMVIETNFVEGEGFRVALAFENETGYFPMDYRWGNDREDLMGIVKQCVDEHNARLGLSTMEAMKIVLSTMRL